MGLHIQVEHVDEMDEGGWEYVEEGPPEIIWQGNEIIVKKKKVRVKKKDADQQVLKEVSLSFFTFDFSDGYNRLMFEIL